MKMQTEKGRKISEKLRELYKDGLPPAHLESIRAAHRRPEVRERHRQATIRQLAACTDRSPMHTPIEKRLASALEDAGVSFATQQRLLDRYVVDFLIIGKPLVIEADGFTHKLPRSKAKDAERDANLIAAGFTVLRFPGWQIMRYADECVAAVISMLESLDGQLPTTQTVIIGNQDGKNNPAYGKPAWNRGLKAETDERQRRLTVNSKKSRDAGGWSDRLRARWAEYRKRFNWEQMKVDYLSLHSVRAVAEKHGIGKRQLYEFLRREGVVLDGKHFTPGRPKKQSTQDIV